MTAARRRKPPRQRDVGAGSRSTTTKRAPRAPTPGTPPERKGKSRRRILEPQWIAFGQHVRALLARKGLSEDQFQALLENAECDVHRTMLSKILNGYIPPPERSILGIRHLARSTAGRRGRKRAEGETRAKPMIMRAQSTPWAEVLRLKGEERERFEEAAWVARSPTPIMHIIARLRARIDGAGAAKHKRR